MLGPLLEEPVVMFAGTAEAGKALNPSGAAVAVGRLNVTFLLLGGTAADTGCAATEVAVPNGVTDAGVAAGKLNDGPLAVDDGKLPRERPVDVLTVVDVFRLNGDAPNETPDVMPPPEPKFKAGAPAIVVVLPVLKVNGDCACAILYFSYT